MLNQDKTELMIFAPKYRAKELTDFSISLSRAAVLCTRWSLSVKFLAIPYNKALP
jgi:hypothetical protein